MFNIGGDDKEKLKENMEEIRNLVNSESEQEDEAQQEVPDMPDEGENQVEEQEPQSRNLGDVNNELGEPREMSQPNTGQEKQDRESKRNSLISDQEDQGPQNRDFSTKGSSASTTNRKDYSSSRQDMKDHLESISSEVKKMEESETRPGETLFLEVDEFNQVQRMVEEMKYLSREMKDLMNNLEDGIEEDRRIEGEAEDVVEDFSERREKIQSALQ